MVCRVIQKKRKYHNIPTTYHGTSYDSKQESYYAMWLDSELRKKRIKKWEKQVKIELKVKGYKICDYYMDFVVYHLDGTKEFVEIKGFPTPVWRLKYKIFEALYGDKKNVKLTVVKV